MTTPSPLVTSRPLPNAITRTTSITPGLAGEASVAPDTVERGGARSTSDIEITGTSPIEPEENEEPDQEKKPDIEHVFVNDDPRKWSSIRKTFTLILISFASMIAGLAASIQNPAIEDMEQRLNATSKQISLSIAVFILIQGIAPLFWSAVTEIKGRKSVYLVSITIFCVGSIVVATSKSIQLVIGFRCAQAAGSSAVLAIGAATLADIYEPAERGTKMGTYYISLALATSIGPIFGGILTQLFHWRGPFWFLTIFSGVSVLAFAFAFKDTFRRERSTTYQSVLRHYAKEKERAMRMRMSKNSSQTAVGDLPADAKLAEKQTQTVKVPDDTRDVERAVKWDTQSDVLTVDEIKLTLKDVNPFKPLWKVVKRRNNFICLFGSGLLFSFNFVVVYTSSRTLGTYYHYNALEIGFILVSFGAGSMIGSLAGGRYSDYVLAKLKAKNGGTSEPEMRLHSTIPGMILLPLCILGFGWVSQQRVHVAVICVMLFLCGLSLIWIYSSTLAYIVDANVGRSSTAVATNSSFRGIAAFVATEVAVPLQDALGDGYMYTMWSGLIIIAELLLLLVLWKGGVWRKSAERMEVDLLSQMSQPHHHHQHRSQQNSADGKPLDSVARAASAEMPRLPEPVVTRTTEKNN